VVLSGSLLAAWSGQLITVMCERQKTQPLWLPEGSIRGIIALALIIGCIGLYAWKGAIPETLATALGLVIREYFASRATQ
jgi:hypothetical protein